MCSKTKALYPKQGQFRYFWVLKSMEINSTVNKTWQLYQSIILRVSTEASW